MPGDVSHLAQAKNASFARCITSLLLEAVLRSTVDQKDAGCLFHVANRFFSSPRQNAICPSHLKSAAVGCFSQWPPYPMLAPETSPRQIFHFIVTVKLQEMGTMALGTRVLQMSGSLILYGFGPGLRPLIPIIPRKPTTSLLFSARPLRELASLPARLVRHVVSEGRT